MPRQLVCKPCGVMYKLRDYEGRPEYDMELQELIQRHLHQATDPRPESHESFLFHIGDKDAGVLDVEAAVQRKMQESEIFIRETRDDLKVEALKCFQRHGAPKGLCPDWCDKSKAIGRTIGVAKEDQQFLCQYCPAAAYVAFRERQAAGMYEVTAAEKEAWNAN